MNQKMRKIVLSIGLCIILLVPLAISTTLNVDRINESSSIEENQFVQELDGEVSETGCFIENTGQIGNDDVLLYSKIPGGSIGFTKAKVLLWSHEPGDCIELSFPGGNAVTPSGITPVNEYFNYFLGHRGTFTHVRGYENVMFENLWSGIDLVYKSTPEGAKYEFQVAPGADPSDIRVQCLGQDDLVIDEIDISISKGTNMFKDVGLLVSQSDGDIISATYQRYDDETYGVMVGEYDKSMPLIIDPLIFSTYLGGTDDESGYSTTVDSQDNIIVAGWTWSTDFPVASAYNGTIGGSRDCFISKFSSEGDLLFSTYVGGLGLEFASGVKTDLVGNIYVVISTSSAEFPTTTGAYDESTNGEHDIAVIKLNSAGNTLIFSTVVGGSGQDVAYDLVLTGDAIYVSGYTLSSDIPFTSEFGVASPSGRDILIICMLTDGSDLWWLSVVRGSSDENAYNIDVDANGVVIATGWTNSSDLPVSPSAAQLTNNGNLDAFCLALSYNGASIHYLTYIGGTGEDMGFGLVGVESANEFVPQECVAYITGSTASDDFPTTENAYDRSYNQGGDTFVIKVGPLGTEFSFGTYLGGFNEDQSNSILRDSSDNLIIAGRTASTDFPTLHAYNSSHNGGNDLFISTLNFNGQELISSTFLGGSGDESMTKAFAFDSAENLIISGSTTSTDFPTVGSQVFDDTQNGEMDCFMVVLTSDFSYPEFESIVKDIQDPNSHQDVLVTARVTDPGGVAEVTLQYRTDTSWEDVTMVETSIGSDNWTAAIPALAIDTNVEYRVLANDSAGNSVVSAIDTYLVVAPPPVTIETGMIIAVVTLVAAVLGIIGGAIKLRAAQIDKGIGIGKKDT